MILHQVLTPEKVRFSYRVAGLGARFLAWLVDICFLGILFVAGLLMASILEMGRQGLGIALTYLWMFALNWGYFLLFEWLWQGGTPGKRLVGIRVIQSSGTAISFTQAAVRNLLRAVDCPFLLPGCYALGFTVAYCNRENRRLGDLAADTLVVYVERRAQPIRVLHEERNATDRNRLALFRQRLAQLNREQKQTLLDLCLRRDQLRVTERAQLFHSANLFLQERLGLVPDTYQSAEKFILQLSTVLGETNNK